jgi:CTD small phosphatase-like protein 2
MVLVDNSVTCCVPQLDNGVPIIPYFDSDSDTELLKLEVFLNKLAGLNDVRPFLRQYFKLYEYRNSKTIFELYEKVCKPGRRKRR